MFMFVFNRSKKKKKKNVRFGMHLFFVVIIHRTNKVQIMPDRCVAGTSLICRTLNGIVGACSLHETYKDV